MTATAHEIIRDFIAAGGRVAGNCHIEVYPAGASFDVPDGRVAVVLVNEDEAGRAEWARVVVDAAGLAALFAA